MIKRSIIVLMLMVLICGISFAESRVQILKVETTRMGDYDDVSVLTSENIKPEVIMLESPNRIALSFANATIEATLTIAGPSPFIRMVQAAQFDKNTVYVIVEPNEKLAYEYTSIIGRNKFILEFTKAKPESKKFVMPSPPVTMEVVAKKPTPEAIAAKLPPTAEVIAILPVTELITKEFVITAEAKPLKKLKPEELLKIPLPLQGKTIVIDPGHGGRDPGYIGKTGIFEKFLNMKIASKLKKLLTDAGAKVVMTRTKDISIRDRDIVALTNNSDADLFVAIHLNCYASPRAGGTQTFYFTPQSKNFAKLMQKNLTQTIKLRNRGVKKETYYVVHHTNIPSVLVESVYLTNPKEEKLVMTPEFQSKVAYGMYKGIKEYVKISSWQRSPK